MQSQGMLVETKVLETSELLATEELAEQMNIAPQTKLYSIKRIKKIGRAHV